MHKKNVLLIGATGVFGRRLAKHLARFGDISLIVSSRDGVRAQQLADALNGGGTLCDVRSVELDHRKNLQALLAKVMPWLAINASGPFQQENYNVPIAALNAGTHIIDMADARDYLSGYSDALNNLATEKKLCAIAGASSTPALSGAAVAGLVDGWQRVDNIDICITPGGRSKVGRAVIEAILSYVGKPVPIWQDGRLTQTIGWLNSRHVEIPGLGRRAVAPVETFDAELLGQQFDVTSRVTFSAGLESPIEQFGLQLLARLVNWGVLANLRPLIPLLLAARQITRLATSNRGDMLVDVTGLDANGNGCRAHWSLLAKNDDGPYVPVLPVAAIVRKLLANKIPAGAQLASSVLTLPEIVAEMAPYAITLKRDHLGGIE